MSDPRLATRCLIVLLFAGGLLRAGWLLWHQPLLAYANNYDQVRYTACLQVYQVNPGAPVGLQTPDAPLELWQHDPTVHSSCYWTSDVLFIAAARVLSQGERVLGGDGAVSIRWIGSLRLLVAALALAWVLRGLWRTGRSDVATGLAVVWALVFCDPALTLYANGFYADFSGFTGLLLSTALLLLAWVRPLSRCESAMLCAATLLLVMAKIQYAPVALGAALALAIAAVWRPQLRSGLAVLLLAATLGFAIQVWNAVRPDPFMQKLGEVSRSNTVFNAVLGQTEDPVRTASLLGLDAACAQYAGKHFFNLPGAPAEVCPSYAGFTRARLLRVFLDQPLLYPRMIGAALSHLNPWLVTDLGHVAGEPYGQVPLWSLSRLLEAWPRFTLFLPLLPLTLACGLWFVRRAPPLAFATSLWTGALIGVGTAFAAVGDGVAFFGRQGCFVLGLACAWGIGLLATAAWRSLFGDNRPPHAAP